jgi:hypothetical protein
MTLCVTCHLGKTHNQKPPKACRHCQTNARRLGMCQKHYQRWKKYGDPFLTKKREPGKPSGFILAHE